MTRAPRRGALYWQRPLTQLPPMQSLFLVQPQMCCGRHTGPKAELLQSPPALHPQVPPGMQWAPSSALMQSGSPMQPQTPAARHVGPLAAVEQSTQVAPGNPHDVSESTVQSLFESQQPLHCVPGPHVVPHVSFG